MHGLRWIAALVSLAFMTPAQTAQTDPELVLYRVPGVADSGGAGNTGTATAFHCTNFSGVTENIRFVVKSNFGKQVANVAIPVDHLNTLTAVTKGTVAYNNDLLLDPGAVQQGMAAIAATSIHVMCTAQQVDAAAAVPQGIALRMIRFNPIPETQE